MILTRFTIGPPPFNSSLFSSPLKKIILSFPKINRLVPKNNHQDLVGSMLQASLTLQRIVHCEDFTPLTLGKLYITRLCITKRLNRDETIIFGGEINRDETINFGAKRLVLGGRNKWDKLNRDESMLHLLTHHSGGLLRYPGFFLGAFGPGACRRAVPSQVDVFPCFAFLFLSV